MPDKVLGPPPGARPGAVSWPTMKSTAQTLRAPRAFALALLLGAGALSAAQSGAQSGAHSGAHSGALAGADEGSLSKRMAERTTAFLAGLDEGGTRKATTSYDDPERRTWAFGPVTREGIALGALSKASMERLEAILDEALSEKGMDAWHEIRELESVLRERESKPGNPATHRDPDLYWLRVYGTPGAKNRWSVRFEGHHLALHVSFVPGEPPATTPFFIGASPLLNARDKDVTVEAFRVLRQKTDRLLATLADGAASLGSGGKPKDVRMGPGQWDLPPEGAFDLASATKQQISAANDLLASYQELLEPELRGYALEAGAKATFDHWGARTVDGERAWSLRTPSFALELCTTTGAGHIHALLRDTKRDFGGKSQ